jgi:hypothetical protein
MPSSEAKSAAFLGPTPGRYFISCIEKSIVLNSKIKKEFMKIRKKMHRKL